MREPMVVPFASRTRVRSSSEELLRNAKTRWLLPGRRMQQFRRLAASCMMMDSERREHDLALQARAGDREALAELVERTRLGLFALAYADLRHYEDAQDAVAAALLQI